MKRYAVTIRAPYAGHRDHAVTVEAAYPQAAKREALHTLPYRPRADYLVFEVVELRD